jgi:hypothetical protein
MTMKKQTTRIAVLSLLFMALALPSQVIANAEDADESLPKSWYTLPEDAGPEDQMDEAAYWDNRNLLLRPKQEAAIDRLFRVNSKAFDLMESRLTDSSLSHREEKKWYLAACILDVTLSLSGTMGMMMAKGDASAAIYWRKVQDSLDSQPVVGGAEESEADASFATTDTRDEVETKLEPIIRMVMASGEVKDEAALRRNLIGSILDYHLIMQNLHFDAAKKWEVSRLRLDFSIDISGKVSPAVTIGGGIKLRFEWEPRPATIRMAHASPKNDQTRKIGDNLKKLVETMAKELDQVPLDAQASGFTLNQLKFGLGLFAEGKMGVVKLGGSVFGYLYLNKKSDVDESAPILTNNESDHEIPIIDYTGNTQYETWAQAHGVHFERFSNRDGEGHSTVYSIVGKKFRDGIERSVKIGNKIAERASKHKNKWEVYQLKTEFALSISGGTSLFKLGGTGAIELVFKK